MAGLDSRDMTSEMEGKEGHDAAKASHHAPGSHVTYRTEDDETVSGPTKMQKLKERVSDFENHLKGKERSEVEDPHPELAYIPPGDGKGDAAADLHEGKQHGGVPIAALDKDVPAEATRDHVNTTSLEGPRNSS